MLLVRENISIGETTSTPSDESGVRPRARCGREPTLLASALLTPAYVFSDNNRVDDAVDHVVHKVDELLSAGRFSDVDSMLHELEVESIHSDVSVALLMATFPAREQLRERAHAIAKLTPRLARTDPEDLDELLRILG